MYNIFNNQDKNLNFPLLQNKKKNEYYYDFGTGKNIKIPSEEKDPFVEGFNSTQNGGTSGKQENNITSSAYTTLEASKPKNVSASTDRTRKTTRYSNTQATTPQGYYVGGDIKTDEDKSLFMTGFREENAKAQKPNADALEFGEDSETYKILQDLSRRWYDADPTEKARLHGVAEEVRRLARAGDQVVDRTNEIMDTMHKNAETAKEYQYQIQSSISSPLTEMGHRNNFLESAAYLIGMVNRGPWDYKYDDDWRVPMAEGKTTFDGHNLSQDNYRNYLKWMYFDGHLLGADKVGNMNMAYVGKKMNLPEWVYKNPYTTDKDDAEWVERGISLAESGR